MPYRLDTTIKNMSAIPNSVNAGLVSEFLQYMIANGSSERHQNNSLKAIICCHIYFTLIYWMTFQHNSSVVR
jgi:hypothetical protein